MAPRKKLILATIIALVIVSILVVLRRRRSPWRAGRRDKYSIGNPAEPRQREASTDVLAAVDSIVRSSSSIDVVVGNLPLQEKDALDSLESAQTALKTAQNISSVLARARAACGASSSCTSSGALALYKGLCNSDSMLLGTAQRLINAGQDMQQRADADTAIGDSSKLSEAGMHLVKMGGHIRQLVKRLHVLGVSLDLE